MLFKSQVIHSLQREQITVAFDSLKTVGLEEMGDWSWERKHWKLKVALQFTLEEVIEWMKAGTDAWGRNQQQVGSHGLHALGVRLPIKIIL